MLIIGLLLMVVVTPANVQDRDGAITLFSKILDCFERLALVWADSAYNSHLLDWVKKMSVGFRKCHKAPWHKRFRRFARRWVVERTFAWLGRYRRFSKDYEQQTAQSEALIYAAMVHIIVRRLR